MHTVLYIMQPCELVGPTFRSRPIASGSAAAPGASTVYRQRARVAVTLRTGGVFGDGLIPFHLFLSLFGGDLVPFSFVTATTPRRVARERRARRRARAREGGRTIDPTGCAASATARPVSFPFRVTPLRAARCVLTHLAQPRLAAEPLEALEQLGGRLVSCELVGVRDRDRDLFGRERRRRPRR